MGLTADDKLKRARIQIQRRNPFFAYLSLYLKFHEDSANSESIGVSPTGDIYYNKKF